VNPSLSVATLGDTAADAPRLADAIAAVQIRKSHLAGTASVDATNPRVSTFSTPQPTSCAAVEYATPTRTYRHLHFEGRADCVRKLITGEETLDGAVLVVNAAEGPSLETRELLLVAQKFDVPAILIFLDEADLVEDQDLLELVELEIRDLLSRRGFPGDETPVIRGNVQKAIIGDKAASRAIQELLDAMDAFIPLPKAPSEEPFRMPIEDVFTIEGRGTVVTGRIERGEIQRLGEAEIVGAKGIRRTVVTAIEQFRKLLDRAGVGEQVGLLLSDVSKADVAPGMVLAKPGSIFPCNRFKAEVRLLSQEEGGRHIPFFSEFRPQFHFHSVDVTGQMNGPAGMEMAVPGDTLSFEVNLATPVALERNGRFTIREGGRTIAVGRVSEVSQPSAPEALAPPRPSPVPPAAKVVKPPRRTRDAHTTTFAVTPPALPSARAPGAPLSPPPPIQAPAAPAAPAAAPAKEVSPAAARPAPEDRPKRGMDLENLGPPSPPPRYADVGFKHDKNGQPAEVVPDTTILQARKWYWLEVAVRMNPTGLKSSEPIQPIPPINQDSNVELLVSVESEEFEFEEKIGRITLPKQGDSIKSAHFRLRGNQLQGPAVTAKIAVRIFYRFNLIEFLAVTAAVGPQEQTGATTVQRKEQQTVNREYLNLDKFQPRMMNIHIQEEGGVFVLCFTLTAPDKATGELKETYAFTGECRLTDQDLDDKLARLRQLLGNLCLKDYLHKLEGDAGDFRETLLPLIKFGQELWLSLFRNPPGSALDLLGRELRRRPLEQGGLIQVSMPDKGSRFLYPWAFVYDRDLPQESYQMPDLDGFWGYRYGIEQHLSDRLGDLDAPVRIAGKMSMAFMLWDSFPNAKDQEALMSTFRAQSGNQIEISDPPVTAKDECFERLRSENTPLLYFFAHGHCRKRLTTGAQPDPLAFLKAYLEQLDPNSAERRQLESLARRLQGKATDNDASYIELSHGRLYFYDLLALIEELPSEPFVFLNMCESAEITPRLQENFVSLFLGLKARAVLGTECPMTVNFAHPFSEIFLREVFKGSSLADALRTARRTFLDLRNPLGLAYTLYGSGTLCFLPPRFPLAREALPLGSK
jgi:elongation factor Tu